MIYLDYSANTPADERVLARFCAVERRCPGNANSHHQAGLDAKAEIDHATQTIARLLRVQPSRGWSGSPAMWASISSLPRWSTRLSAAP